MFCQQTDQWELMGAKLLSAAIADGLLHGQFPKHRRDHLLSQHLHNVLPELFKSANLINNIEQ